MVPFFIIEMLMGLAIAANASGGSICPRVAPISGESASEGVSDVCAMPLLALNHTPVPLTLGKYLVKASLRCCCAAAMACWALRMAMLLCRAESMSCSRAYSLWAAAKALHTEQRVSANIFFINYFRLTFQ